MIHDYSWLPEAARTDERYAPAAYEFLFESLAYTRRRLANQRGREIRHVTGVELVEGLRELALKQFGLMAKAVLNAWGMRITSDVGEMVYRLIESGDMSKTPEDKRSDFDNVYDFDEAFCQSYRIEAHRPG